MCPSIPQELPAPHVAEARPYRRLTCHVVTSSLAGQTCAVSCMLPPVESVLTSGDTDTKTRARCLGCAFDDTIFRCLHRFAQESFLQPMSWVGFSSPVTPSLTSQSGHTSPAIALANGGASFALTGHDDDVTALPDPWSTVALGQMATLMPSCICSPCLSGTLSCNCCEKCQTCSAYRPEGPAACSCWGYWGRR